MIRRFAVFWFTVSTILILKSQNRLEFTKVDFGYGKNQTIIYNIAQDQQGYIWIATDEGLIRYNSHESYLYNEYGGLPKGVKTKITRVFVDSKNNIWAGNEDGIMKLDRKTNFFIDVKDSNNQRIGAIKAIKENSKKELFIASNNGIWNIKQIVGKNELASKLYSVQQSLQDLVCDGNYVFFCTKERLFSLNLVNQIVKTIDSSKSYTTLLIHGNDLFWGTNNGSIYKYTINGSHSPINKVLQEVGFPITKILPIESRFYISTDGKGIIVVDHNFNQALSLSHDSDQPRSISNNGVYDLFYDKERLLWAATYGGGVNKADLSEKLFYNVNREINKSNTLINNFARSILEDAHGKLWIGTKEGLSILDPKNQSWKNILSFRKNATPDIIMALKEQGDYIWAGTYGNGVYKINKNNLTFKEYSPSDKAHIKINLSKVYTIAIDRRNNVWLGGIDGNVHQISSNDEVKSYALQPIRNLSISRNGHILASGKNGAFKIIDDNIQAIKGITSGKNGLDYTTINVIHEKSDGNYLLATNGDGVLLYDNKTNLFEAINYRDGLPSDVVQSIISLDDNQYWLGTTKGLVNLQIVKGSKSLLRVYNERDGLLNSNFNFGSSYTLKNGDFAFGTSEGIVLFNPNKIKGQEIIPTVVFEELEIMTQSNSGKKITTVSNSKEIISLNYNENSINVKFTGILHKTAARVLYSWKLKGANSDWSIPSERDQLLLTRLQPGKYSLLVKASNRDNKWSDPVELNIYINPPWWLSVYAKIFYFLLLLGLINALYKVTEVFFRKKQVEEQISFYNNITHELKTPLAILLSSLDKNTVGESNQELISKVKSTVTKLSSLFEQLLNYDKINSQSFDELEVIQIPIKSYFRDTIAGFKPLMDDKNLSAILNINAHEEFMYHKKDVIDRIFFNLFSNAIKYSKNDKEIIVEVKVNSEKIYLTIIDKGIGIPKDQQALISKRYYRARNVVNSQLPGTGLGLMIVRNLIDIDKGEFKFESEENVGTTFNITLQNYKSKFVNPIPSSDIIDNEGDTFDKSVLDDYSNAKILVVEDNDELRKSLVDKLSEYFEVYEAINGKEALHVMRSHYVDLVITDYIMPEIDGQELVKQIQADISLSHIPVFMMSVINNSASKTESIISGVLEYFDKPINFNILLAKLVSTFNRQRKLRDKYLHETDVTTSEKFKNSRDVEFMNTLEEYILNKISDEEISVISLSKHVGMSRTALYMKLKSLLDLSPQNFIILTKLKHARQLLLEGNHNITEVAFMTGFANPKYFSTSFKKQFGESPSAFLKGLQE